MGKSSNHFEILNSKNIKFAGIQPRYARIKNRKM